MTKPWIASGKHRRCPVCGRDTDDKCRRSDDLLSCYWGERFTPPAGLKLGQVLDIEGRRWAVVNLSGGFSDNSLILRPHVDRVDFKPAQRLQRRREVAVLAPALRDVFARVRAYVHATLALPDPHQATAEDVRLGRELLEATRRHLQDLRDPLAEARRDDPSLGRLMAAVEQWQRLVDYQAADLEIFHRWVLGTPSPEAVASLAQQGAS
ncbi:hypothetical protein [Synechococcus sp. CCAP 1479/9]|uniref:hypothetical protein n=1 Tax=Synechococcus sp. CCAP 1479/9 TaxID=1221593 RepID=UPI001C213BC8|nr:hypothetical protein [Synechococcus sp. CCAP 1479/9]